MYGILLSLASAFNTEMIKIINKLLLNHIVFLLFLIWKKINFIEKNNTF